MLGRCFIGSLHADHALRWGRWLLLSRRSHPPLSPAAALVPAGARCAGSGSASTAADGTEVAFSIQGRTLEFVLTDGQGNWDKPSPTQNYVIDEPGAFVLSKGAVVPEEES